MLAKQIWGASDQPIFGHTPNLNDVIRNQSVAARDQIERGFRFSDPRQTLEQNAQSINIQQNAVSHDYRRKHLLQERSNQLDGFRTQ